MHQRGSCRIQFGNKHVPEGRLKGAFGRWELTVRLAGYIRVSICVDGDHGSVIVKITPEVGRVNESVAGRVQPCHKRVRTRIITTCRAVADQLRLGSSGS